jgi:hypothetical protein
MEIEKVYALYFSPRGQLKKHIAVASGAELPLKN